MIASTACERVEIRQIPAVNDTWADPSTWKKCAGDLLKEEDGKLNAQLSMQAAENLRRVSCRMKCGADKNSNLCQTCNSFRYW
jgi:hypothetical protein